MNPQSAASFQEGDGDAPSQLLRAKIDRIVRDAGRDEAFRDVFVNDVWSELRPDYDKMVKGLQHYCKEKLGQMGITCNIQGRAKTQESVRKSLERREDHLWEKEHKRYAGLEDIFHDIHDLAGIRIVVTFPSDIGKAGSFIQQSFRPMKAPAFFRPDGNVGQFWKPWFGAYECHNHRVSLENGKAGALSQFCDVMFEIQLTTCSEDVYNSLAHSLRYKRSSGPLTLEDEMVIDMSHETSLLYNLCLMYFKGKLDKSPNVSDELLRAVGHSVGNEAVADENFSVRPGGKIRREELMKALESPPEECHSIADLQRWLTKKLDEIRGSNPASWSNDSGRGNQFSAGNDKARRKNEILKNLKTSRYKDTKDRNPRRIPGTCEWFVTHESFREWQQSKSSCLLWVSADPGCGKTTCYFFFNDDFQDQRSVRGALCCILHQLFTQKEALFSDKVLDQFKADRESLTSSFAELWDVLIAAAEDENAGEIVCIFDALDQCNDQDRSYLGKALCDFYGAERGLNLKILITSRPYSAIRRGLPPPHVPGLPVIHLSGESDVEREKISQEVNLFIKHRVRNLRLNLTLTEQDLLLQGLMRVPNPTYLWVYLTLDLAEKEIGNGINEDKISQVTTHLPKTVDEAYDKILSKSCHVEVAKRLLHIVVAATRPLTLKEMDFALALQEYHESYTHIDSHLIPEERFREFVQDLCGLFVRPQESHRILSEICIRHLLFSEFETHSLKGDVGLSQYAESHVFLDYSAKNWAVHLRESQIDFNQVIESILRICDMGSKRCSTWFRIYWTSTNTDFPEGFTSLMIASYFGLTTVVGHLLRMDDVDLNRMDATYGRSSLSWAAENGFDTVVKLLIKGRGSKMVQMAMPFRVRQRLNIAAKVDLVDKSGRTPLSYAAWRGHVKVVELLRRTGEVDFNRKDDIDATPLYYAICGDHQAVVDLLEGSDVNPAAIRSKVLFSAAKKGQKSVVEQLLTTGKVDVNSKDNDGRTPLLWAARHGNEAVVKLLVATSKVDVNLKDNDGRTPLSYAAGRGYEAVVKLLIVTGRVDVNLKDNDGRTPLSWAALSGHEAVVKLLFDTGKVDVNSKDKDGQTPLLYAAANGHVNLSGMLRATDREWGGTGDLQSCELGHTGRELEDAAQSTFHDSGIGTSVLKVSPRDSCAKDEAASFVDSGNATASLEKSEEPQLDVQDCKDVGTDYSIGASLPDSEKDACISELAKDLIHHVRENLRQTSRQVNEQLGEEALKRTHEILPELLRGFALKIGYNTTQEKPIQERRDNKEHHAELLPSKIAESFEEHLSDIRLDDADRMTPNEKVEFWRVEQTQDFSLDDKEPNESFDDEVNELFDDESNKSFDGRVDEPFDGRVDEPFDGRVDESFDGRVDEEDNEERACILKYRPLIHETDAYQWLLRRFHRELCLTPVEPDLMGKIGRKIIESLPSSYKVSRKSSSDMYGMSFRVDWDPRAFITSQDYGVQHGEAIEMAITLTGSDKDAQALGCSEYLGLTWPWMEEKIRQILKGIIRDDSGNELSDGTKLTVWTELSSIVVEASGTPYSLAEIAEVFAWLGSALRPHQFPKTNDSSVVYCRPSIDRIPVEGGPSSRLDTQSHDIIRWDMRFEIRKGLDDHRGSSGQCWFNLFETPVIVEGYPIRRRPEYKTGLEIPLDAIAELAQATHATTFDGRFFIKGCWTMLVLAKAAGDFMIWHLIFNEDKARSSYLDPRVADVPSEGIKHVKLSDISTFRHVVGWCPDARKSIEVQEPDANGNFPSSELEAPGHDCRFKDVRVDRGIPLVRSDTRLVFAIRRSGRGSPDGYLNRIQTARDRFVILFDVNDNRAWLVDAASALLHLVLASLERTRADKDFGDYFCFKLKIPPFDPKKNQAVGVLMDQHNRSQGLQHDSTELFTNRVDSIWCVLDMVLEYQTKINNQDKTRSELLEGFKFEDIVTPEESEFRTCVKQLHPSGRTWVSLTREVNAVTIFGCGFGQLIKPTDSAEVCRHWKQVPLGMDYLAVCVSDLQNTLKRRKGIRPAGPLEVMGDVYWHTPDKIFEGCECQSNLSKCNRAQVLFSGDDLRGKADKAFRPPDLDKFLTGAVIFGDSSKCARQTEDTSDGFESNRGSSTSTGAEYLATSTSPSPTMQTVEESSDTGLEPCSIVSHHPSSPVPAERNPTLSEYEEPGSRVRLSKPSVNIIHQDGTSRQSYLPSSQQAFPESPSDAEAKIPPAREENHGPARDGLREHERGIRISPTETASDECSTTRKESPAARVDKQDRQSTLPFSKSLTSVIVSTSVLIISLLCYDPNLYYRTVLVSAFVTSLWFHFIWSSPKFNTGFMSIAKLLVAVLLLVWWWCISPMHVYTWTPLDAWTGNMDYSSIPTYETVHQPGEAAVVEWNYDVAAFDIKDHAKRLLTQIEDINQALDLAISESNSVAAKTKGILFFGVPHYGTKASFWASLLSCTAYWRGSSTSLLEIMAEGGATIEQLDKNFNRFYIEPSSTVIPVKPYIRDFVEAKFERFGQLSMGLTVDFKLGKYRYAKEPIKLERDHRGLNKFRSSTDPEFRLFFRHFKEALDYAQNV
ncbi:hypothetical protein DL765_008590 [Monosporascus sp. GIB2]|nr:hypothetical protein DL765_008590 [Monosporascus sp. GIB2]